MGRVLLRCGCVDTEGDAVNPLNPNQILRNLDNGFVMTRYEQAEAAAYIRHLQKSNEALKEGMIEFAETIFKLHQRLKTWGEI